MINTDTLVDDTDKQGSIPPSEFRREEALRIEAAYLREQLKRKEITAKKFRSTIDKTTRGNYKST